MERLLAIISLGQNIYGKWLFRRFVSLAIGIAILALVASVVVSAVVLLSFYIAYLLFLHIGFIPLEAVAAVGILGALIATFLILLIKSYIRNLNDLPQHILKRKIPKVSQIGEVIDAFLSGLMG